MILPILGFSTNIPSKYEEIIRRLRMLGLEPTGNIELDKSRLKQAIDKKIEKFEENKKNEKEIEEISKEKELAEKRLGAQTLSEQNRFLFGL